MLSFIGTKKDVAEFVTVVQKLSTKDSLSITIIRRAKSEVSSVSIATATSLDDTVKAMALSFCLTPTDT